MTNILDDLINIINKQFGEGKIIRASEFKLEKVSIGIPILDYVMGGGIPRGRLIQIYGQLSTGKTMIGLRTIAEAQKRGEKCAFIDTEKTFDGEWAKKIGIDIDKLHLVQPDYGEEAFDIIETLVKSNLFSIIVLDSIASLVPLAELKAKMEQQHMGLSARMVNKALRKLIAGNKDTILFFINQVRERIGVVYGSPYTRTGGRGLDFISSIMIKVRRGQWLENDKKQKIGHYIVCDITKNKLAAPHQNCQFPFYFDGTIDNRPQYVQIALEENLIEKKGSWYTFENEKFQGIQELGDVIIKNKKLISKIEDFSMKGIKYIK